jgi:uncharacterized coiled-coil protein SlyX
MIKNKIKNIKNEIEEAIAPEEKEILREIVYAIRKSAEETKQRTAENQEKTITALSDLQTKIEEGGEKSAELLALLTSILKKFKVDIPTEFEVNVKNWQKFPEEIKVTNFPETKFPESFEIKKPEWLMQIPEKKWVEISSALAVAIVKGIRGTPIEVDLDRYRDANRPISVRLSNGKSFYEAIARAVVASGGGIPFKTASGKVIEALVTEDGHLVTDVTLSAGDIEIGAVEIKDGTSDTRATVGANGLYVDVRSSVAPTGSATSAKQDSQISLQTQLETLADTLQELIQRLSPLAGAIASGTASIRITPLTSVSTAVTGPLTNAQYVATPIVGGVHFTQKTATENLTAIESNIINAVAA